MSLINDALKRASQAQAKAESTPAAEFKFRSVDPQEPRSKRSVWFFTSLIVAAAVLAFFLFHNFTHRNREDTNSKPPASVEKQTGSLLANEMKVRAREDEPLPGAPLAAAKTTEPVQTEAVAVVAVSGTTVQELSKEQPTNAPVASPVPPKPAGPKLQAIVFNPSRPSAIISGKSVFVGDRVGEWKVLSITQDTARLVKAGETNVLKLGD